MMLAHWYEGAQDFCVDILKPWSVRDSGSDLENQGVNDMAAKKKAKAKKKAPAKKAKAKKAVAKKITVARKVKKAPAKKAKKKAKKAAPGMLARAIKAVKKAVTPAKKKKSKKQVVGEGNYAASRKFDADQAGFVKKNKAKIPDLGKAAEAALDGPEGDSLREAAAGGRSRDTFEA